MIKIYSYVLMFIRGPKRESAQVEYVACEKVIYFELHTARK